VRTKPPPARDAPACDGKGREGLRMSKRYGIRSSTMAYTSVDGQRTLAAVPVDAIVTVSVEPRDGDGLIEVVWDDKHSLMFSQDLRDRGELLD